MTGEELEHGQVIVSTSDHVGEDERFVFDRVVESALGPTAYCWQMEGATKEGRPIRGRFRAFPLEDVAPAGGKGVRALRRERGRG
jgi:hypothetical protein